MDQDLIVQKFNGAYIADEQTFVMGIHHGFTAHISERFAGQRILETCTGGGFTTMALARAGAHVTTVEIDPGHQDQAKQNVARAGLSEHVTFVLGDILDSRILAAILKIDAAFIDPDWAVSGPDHCYRFRNSNTRPPADKLLNHILNKTPNVAIILPPLIDVRELEGLPPHEREALYLGNSRELYCLYFGNLMRSAGETKFRISTQGQTGA